MKNVSLKVPFIIKTNHTGFLIKYIMTSEHLSNSQKNWNACTGTALGWCWWCYSTMDFGDFGVMCQV